MYEHTMAFSRTEHSIKLVVQVHWYQWLLQLVNQHKQRSSQNEHSTNTRTLRGCAVWNKSWRDAKSYITWYRYAGHVVQNWRMLMVATGVTWYARDAPTWSLVKLFYYYRVLISSIIDYCKSENWMINISTTKKRAGFIQISGKGWYQLERFI